MIETTYMGPEIDLSVVRGNLEGIETPEECFIVKGTGSGCHHQFENTLKTFAFGHQ